MAVYRKKLIEVALPLDAINSESAREKSIRHGHPSTLHLWWARRPLAACRAVLFAQLVDDPSAWPELFPTPEQQEVERERLFRILRELVKWENSASETVVGAARVEIARSIARGRKSRKEGDLRDDEVLSGKTTRDAVDRYLAEVAPIIREPFAGGGSIPLEAQRLGLRVEASDLNPVSVLINKALIEIPPRFASRRAVNPEARSQISSPSKGARGLAADVRYYGQWMRDEAFRRVGHLYPTVRLPKANGGGEGTVIAWLWARTVASPNPAYHGVHVPLISSFWLCKKKGRETWLEPDVNKKARTWAFKVRAGQPEDIDEISAGTKTGRGDFQCLLSGSPIPVEYVRDEARAQRVGYRLLAIIAEGKRRVYLPVDQVQEDAATLKVPVDSPDTSLPAQALGFRVQNYGMLKHRNLFIPRQLAALTTFCGLVGEARARVLEDARAAGLIDGKSLEEGGEGAYAYADAVAIYLAIGVSRRHDRWTSLSIWHTSGEKVESLIRLNALPMTWEFAEANPFSQSTGNWLDGLALTAVALEGTPAGVPGEARQWDATAANETAANFVVSTDPPYYDNIPYADLSDLFYIWLRRSLGYVLPSLFKTVLVPKTSELIADHYRHESKTASEKFFRDGMSRALHGIHELMSPDYPTTIFYAFKQSESTRDGTWSTGWETFLSALLDEDFMVVGTWPMRTEQTGGLRNQARNSLASSIILVCRRRPSDAPSISRTDFRRLLRAELPSALRALERGYIAPVDMAQATIGPGMEIFSRHRAVLGSDDIPMSVRDALIMINEALDEQLLEAEGALDSYSRFAVTWFEANGFKTGSYGTAEDLAKARNVSVEGVRAAGILHSAASKVRLLTAEELKPNWDPQRDERPTAWEAVHHLIVRLERQGENAAADLLQRLGGLGEQARGLTYRLYSICERNGWAEEARAYNGLVTVWSDLESLASPGRAPASQHEQAELFAR